MDTAGTVNPVSSDWSGSIPLRPTKYARFVYRLGHPVFIRARAVRLRYRVPYRNALDPLYAATEWSSAYIPFSVFLYGI